MFPVCGEISPALDIAKTAEGDISAPYRIPPLGQSGAIRQT
jgi:hypothetical protein